jgi:hypothetical protein
VRVAIDEAGEFQGVTRAVIAMQSELRAAVRRVCKLADTMAVDITVGGTGTCSGAPEYAHGSEAYPNYVRTVDMEYEFSGWFAARPLPEVFEQLIRSTTNVGTSQSAVASLEGLRSNARMGALIHQGLSRVANFGQRAKLLNFPAGSDHGGTMQQPEAVLECYLGGVTIDAMEGFFRMNALATLSRAALQRALADAMSIDINGFDAIADDRTVEARRSGQPALREQLVTKYGLLHDRAKPVKRKQAKPAHMRELKPCVKDGGAAVAADEVLHVPADCYGRYVMPAAARALFVAWCVNGLPRTHGGSDADGFERLAWQWGAALQLCVAKGSSMRELLLHVCRGRTLPYPRPDEGPAEVPVPGRDRAFRGRALVAAPLGQASSPDLDPYSSVRRWEIRETPEPLVPAHPHDTAGAHLVESRTPFPFAKKRTEIFDCCGAVLGLSTVPCTVAVLNAPGAAYADAAFFARLPARDEAPTHRFEALLLQARFYTVTAFSQGTRDARKSGGEKSTATVCDTPSSTVDTEFRKMRVNKSRSERTWAQEADAVVTHAMLVASPKGTVVRKRGPLLPPAPDVPGEFPDQRNVMIHIEIDESGVVVEAENNAVKEAGGRLPPLYPLAARRLHARSECRSQCRRRRHPRRPEGFG